MDDLSSRCYGPLDLYPGNGSKTATYLLVLEH